MVGFGIICVALALNLWLGSVVGYRLAPSAGYRTEDERDDWRRFGWNWGIGGVIWCWAVDRVAPQRPDRHVARSDWDWAFRPVGLFAVVAVTVLLALLPLHWPGLFPGTILVWVVGFDNNELTGSWVQPSTFLTFLLGPIGYVVHAVRRRRLLLASP